MEFEKRNARLMAAQFEDPKLRALSEDWFNRAAHYEYSYHFTWMGRPVIQLPQDILALQEIVWRTRPDLIIECGIARGGSLILHASLLELLGGDGRVLGIDVDIRPINREEIEAHPMYRRITMIEGSSVDPDVVAQVREAAADHGSVMVVLDSNHTADHVLSELRHYSPLVSGGCYLVVFDTVIHNMDSRLCEDRSWGRGNSPRDAVERFLADSDDFEVDTDIDRKLLITAAPGGYLRCVRAPAPR